MTFLVGMRPGCGGWRQRIVTIVNQKTAGGHFGLGGLDGQLVSSIREILVVEILCCVVEPFRLAFVKLEYCELTHRRWKLRINPIN